MLLEKIFRTKIFHLKLSKNSNFRIRKIRIIVCYDKQLNFDLKPVIWVGTKDKPYIMSHFSHLDERAKNVCLSQNCFMGKSL